MKEEWKAIRDFVVLKSDQPPLPLFITAYQFWDAIKSVNFGDQTQNARTMATDVELFLHGFADVVDKWVDTVHNVCTLTDVVRKWRDKEKVQNSVADGTQRGLPLIMEVQKSYPSLIKSSKSAISNLQGAMEQADVNSVLSTPEIRNSLCHVFFCIDSTLELKEKRILNITDTVKWKAVKDFVVRDIKNDLIIFTPYQLWNAIKNRKEC